MLCILFISNTNASTIDVSMDFRKDGSCLVKCGTTEKVFNNINELSNGLNSITGDYFNITSIIVNNNMTNIFSKMIKEHTGPIINGNRNDIINSGIIFNGIRNKLPCNVLISSSNNYSPGVILNFDDNGVHFPKLLIKPSIKLIDMKTNSSDNVKIDEMILGMETHFVVKQNVGNGTVMLYDWESN